MVRKRTGRVQFLVHLWLWTGPPQNNNNNNNRRGNIRNFYSPTERIRLKTVGRLSDTWRNPSGGTSREEEIHTQGEERCAKLILDGHLQGQEEREPRLERGALDGADYDAQHDKNVQVEVPALELPDYLLGDGRGIVHGILNVNVLLLYLSGGYNNWDRL